MSTNNCEPIAADLFLYCYERYFIKSLSDTQQYFVSFNSTFRCLNDIFKLDNTYFDQMVSNIYTIKRIMEVLDPHITVNNKTIHTKLYDKRKDFDLNVIHEIIHI
jgi:hypothetical protein